MLGIFSNCMLDFSNRETLSPTPVQEEKDIATFLRHLNILPTAEQRMALIDSFFAVHPPEDFPLVEDSICYFFFRGKGAQFVVGDFNNWHTGNDPFVNIDSTNLFYVMKTFPIDARLDYKFVIDGKWILDPLNPRVIWGGFGPNSELVMPRYNYPSEIEIQDRIPRGTIVEWSFQSKMLNNSRQIWVYLPSEYGDSLQKRYPVIYIQDGGEYLRFANMANVLDNLIAKQKICPLIAVFINPVDRNQEYWLNDQYTTMLVNELVPAVDSTWRTIQDAQERAIMGASLGGVISLYTALRFPNKFRKVASQSGALWIENQRILTLYQKAVLPPLTVYLEWGIFEKNVGEVHRRFQKILLKGGHAVRMEHYSEGHSWGSWRAHIDNILITFWGKS